MEYVIHPSETSTLPPLHDWEVTRYNYYPQHSPSSQIAASFQYLVWALERRDKAKKCSIRCLQKAKGHSVKIEQSEKVNDISWFQPQRDELQPMFATACNNGTCFIWEMRWVVDDKVKDGKKSGKKTLQERIHCKFQIEGSGDLKRVVWHPLNADQLWLCNSREVFEVKLETLCSMRNGDNNNSNGSNGDIFLDTGSSCLKKLIECQSCVDISLSCTGNLIAVSGEDERKVCIMCVPKHSQEQYRSVWVWEPHPEGLFAFRFLTAQVGEGKAEDYSLVADRTLLTLNSTTDTLILWDTKSRTPLQLVRMAPQQRIPQTSYLLALDSLGRFITLTAINNGYSVTFDIKYSKQNGDKFLGRHTTVASIEGYYETCINCKSVCALDLTPSVLQQSKVVRNDRFLSFACAVDTGIQQSQTKEEVKFRPLVPLSASTSARPLSNEMDYLSTSSSITSPKSPSSHANVQSAVLLPPPHMTNSYPPPDLLPVTPNLPTSELTSLVNQVIQQIEEMRRSQHSIQSQLDRVTQQIPRSEDLNRLASGTAAQCFDEQSNQRKSLILRLQKLSAGVANAKPQVDSLAKELKSDRERRKKQDTEIVKGVLKSLSDSLFVVSESVVNSVVANISEIQVDEKQFSNPNITEELRLKVQREFNPKIEVLGSEITSLVLEKMQVAMKGQSEKFSRTLGKDVLGKIISDCLAKVTRVAPDAPVHTAPGSETPFDAIQDLKDRVLSLLQQERIYEGLILAIEENPSLLYWAMKQLSDVEDAVTALRNSPEGCIVVFFAVKILADTIAHDPEFILVAINDLLVSNVGEDEAAPAGLYDLMSKTVASISDFIAGLDQQKDPKDPLLRKARVVYGVATGTLARMKRS